MKIKKITLEVREVKKKSFGWLESIRIGNLHAGESGNDICVNIVGNSEGSFLISPKALEDSLLKKGDDSGDGGMSGIIDNLKAELEESANTIATLELKLSDFSKQEIE